jgi:ligand-binding sensor domain-containing protein/putative methionine-R-sulfoxide reductase with GAF domain
MACKSSRFYNSQKIKLLLLMAASLFVCTSQAQVLVPDARFENYTGRFGFPKEYFVDAIKDAKGYVWACGNGLYRFDGNRVVRYSTIHNSSRGMRENYVHHLQVDEQGRLFCGSSAGLIYYNQLQDSIQYINSIKLQQLQYAYACRVSGNYLWFASQYGLTKLNLSNMQLDTTSLKAYNLHPWYTYAANDSLLLCASGDDVYYMYNIIKDTYQEMHLRQGEISSRIKCIIHFKGLYYMGSGNGIWVTPNLYKQPRLLPNTLGWNVKGLAICHLNNDSLLWMATNGMGLAAFNPTTQALEMSYINNPADPYSLQADNINSIFLDDRNRLWLATETGLSVFNPYHQQYKTQILSFTGNFKGDNYVSNMLQDSYQPNNVWATVNNQGLIKIDWLTKKIIAQYKYISDDSSHGKPGSALMQALQIGPTRLLLRKSGNLELWDEKIGHLKTLNQFGQPDKEAPFFIRQMIQLPNGMVYIATSQGLAQWQIKTGKSSMALYFTKVPKLFNTNDMWSLCYDSSRQLLWIATRGGLVNYHLLTGNTETFYNRSSSDTLNINHLDCVAIGNDAKVYCGTHSALTVFDYTTKKFITQHNLGIYNRMEIFSIIIKKQIVWLSSTAGILQYNTSNGQTLKLSSPSAFAEEYSVFPFTTINNEIVFGNRNAYTYFTASVAQEKMLPSAPIIESISINQQPFFVNDSHEIILTSNQNSISITYTAFEYNFPQHILFRYRMGKNMPWTMATESRTASFSNLSPGSYVFEVQAGSDTGEWNNTMATYSFTIKPSFWQTWWFGLILMGLVLAICIWYYLWRIRQLKNKQQEESKIQQLALEQYQQQLEMEQIINYFSSSLSNKNTQEEVIWDVARNLIHKLGFANCMIYLWNVDKTELIQKAGYGPNGSLDEITKEPFNSKLWQGIVGHVAATKKPIMLGNTSKDPRYRPDVLTRLSELCVPALYDGELISIIDSEDYAENYYTQQHLQILTTIATLMAAKLVSIAAAEET